MVSFGRFYYKPPWELWLLNGLNILIDRQTDLSTDFKSKSAIKDTESSLIPVALIQDSKTKISFLSLVLN